MNILALCFKAFDLHRNGLGVLSDVFVEHAVKVVFQIFVNGIGFHLLFGLWLDRCVELCGGQFFKVDLGHNQTCSCQNFFFFGQLLLQMDQLSLVSH